MNPESLGCIRQGLELELPSTNHLRVRSSCLKQKPKSINLNKHGADRPGGAQRATGGCQDPGLLPESTYLVSTLSTLRLRTSCTNHHIGIQNRKKKQEVSMSGPNFPKSSLEMVSSVPLGSDSDAQLHFRAPGKCHCLRLNYRSNKHQTVWSCVRK